MQKRKKGEWLIWLGAEGTLKEEYKKKNFPIFFSLSLLFLVFGYRWPKHRSSQKKLKRGKVFWLHTRYVQFGPTLAASNSQQKENEEDERQKRRKLSFDGFKINFKKISLLDVFLLLVAPHTMCPYQQKKYLFSL